VTTTFSAVAAPGLAEGEAAGMEAEVLGIVEAAGVETASCASAMSVSKNSATTAIGNVFIKNCDR